MSFIEESSQEQHLLGHAGSKLVGQREKEHEADRKEVSHGPPGELINWEGMALRGS